MGQIVHLVPIQSILAANNICILQGRTEEICNFLGRCLTFLPIYMRITNEFLTLTGLSNALCRGRTPAKLGARIALDVFIALQVACLQQVL